MFPLLETIIGFSVVMLLLSLLVKSMTSVVKNHVDYYSKNLESEVKRLICGTFDQGKDILKEKAPFLKGFQWQRLDEEFLTKENMTWILSKLGAGDDELEYIEARINVHKNNIKFAFTRRTKNISLVVGLVLCLSLNINAFSIWETLYNDQQIRAKFSATDYINHTMTLTEEYNKAMESESQPDKDSVASERKAFLEKYFYVRGEIGFGMGRIWKEKSIDFPIFIYELIGSLLTGILISIGAPYWHDLLRRFSSYPLKKVVTP